jgi:hypothetical protein
VITQFVNSLVVGWKLFQSYFMHDFVCRFVNQKGEVLERLLCVEHVVDTTSANLKRSLDAMFVKHDLSMSRLRGQGMMVPLICMESYMV